MPEGVVFDVDFAYHADLRQFLVAVDIVHELFDGLGQQFLHTSVVARFNKREAGLHELFVERFGYAGLQLAGP